MPWQPPLTPSNLPSLEDVQQAYDIIEMRPVRGCYLGNDCCCPALALYLAAHPNELADLIVGINERAIAGRGLSWINGPDNSLAATYFTGGVDYVEDDDEDETEWRDDSLFAYGHKLAEALEVGVG